MGDHKQLENAHWYDITEPQPLETLTLIEINPVIGHDMLRTREWETDGVLRLDFSADPVWMNLLDAYSRVRARLTNDRSQRTNFFSGWHYPTPYLVCEEIQNIGLGYWPLMNRLNVILNDAALLHLALTGWVSTERNWHQDSYLNPPNVWSSYAAVWIALEDIHEDAGPFEYVPGSHKWEVLRRDKLFRYLSQADRCSPDWPTTTQGEISRICEERIRGAGAETRRFIPKKGEVLIWHSNLIHRGTAPRNPDLLRQALILHYSAASKRPDMKPLVQKHFGMYYDGPVPRS